MSEYIYLAILILSIAVSRLLIGGAETKISGWAFFIRVFSVGNQTSLGWIATLVNLLFLYPSISSQKRQSSTAKTALAEQSSSILEPGPLRPLIIPGRTTHTRLFPKKHSFGYSYLQVGIPIGWKGNVSSILGADDESRSWFRVDAADYLARGQGHLGLEGKLAAYLSSQRQDIKNYAHAYLLTAPRHLGYAFNPVSFWYLFSKDMKLQAMILEVNNTFDERRMYFMKRGVDYDGKEADEDVKFTHSWPKDFHVSPFNSRKGDYSLAAVNPFTASVKPKDLKIDNVITLKSSKGHAKLVARIFSTGTALDPSALRFWSTIRLISAWFWVGLVTYPRIVKEAAKLFFRHKLHVWYRPEVFSTSIGRTENPRETVIASVFVAYLQHQMSRSSTVSSLEYAPPNGSHLDTLVLVPSSTKTQDEKTGQALRFQILSPQFFTDIAHTASPADYILAAEQQALEARTFSTSSYKILAELLRSDETDVQPKSISFRESFHLRLLSLLQRDRTKKRVLDRFAITSLGPEQRLAYFKSSTVLVLAGRFLAGFDGLLYIPGVILEIILAWKVVGIGYAICKPTYDTLMMELLTRTIPQAAFETSI